MIAIEWLLWLAKVFYYALGALISLIRLLRSRKTVNSKKHPARGTERDASKW
ncbi:hypothetical protein [Mechercharimyces sp. CAU 1602]|uniref:hypothetical protein n=1 Tax=Mechercharimyces sp. CAU 1602 TaxID=2973933 RepID=UPI002161D07A|nr:hypothetical protein [Mechercharimyces sp. CAU 1602]